LPKPALQLATVHVLLVQPAVPLAAKQALPQVPQFDELLLVLTSQPSLERPLQSASGAVHELMPQAPFTQLGVEPVGAVHTLPHTPQLFTLVLVLTSQPLAPLPSQF
jgi:hypothetical protein